MVEKLKSVLKIPKLRLGLKTLVLIPVLIFLPLRISAAFAVVLYFLPKSFWLNFLGTFLSLFALSFYFFTAGFLTNAGWLGAVLFAGLFHILLGVKNVIFTHRHSAFLFLFSAISFLSFWGFFAGAVPFLALILIIFLVSRDFFASFSPFSNKSMFMGAVCAFLATQVSWVIFYLNIPLWSSVLTLSLVFGSVFYAMTKHLEGKLFKSDAPFLAVSSVVVAFAIFMMTVF